MQHLRFLSFFFFFFSFQSPWLTRSSVNSVLMYSSWTSQTPFFINFFIKNWSHRTINTFKNYFTTVFSVFSFQFQQNKFYPNRPLDLAFINFSLLCFTPGLDLSKVWHFGLTIGLICSIST